jgi:tRNA G10  N-methylase Trm11
LTNQIIIYDLIKNGNNLDNELVFANNIISINKITMDNKNYLYFILGNKNELYLIEKNENLKNVEIASFKPFENEKINRIIILDNKNIVAVVDGNKLSYYEYKNEQYTKLFNNINKFNAIYELNKFQNNSYYFLTFNENLNIEMILFNEDFTSIEKEISVKRPIRTFRNNKLFKINNNRVVIIGNKEFIVFNLISFEVQTNIFFRKESLHPSFYLYNENYF